MKTKKDELVENWNLNPNAITFGPYEDFDPGIIGVSEDKNHIIYSYQKLTESLSASYERQFYKDNPNVTDDVDVPDFVQDACEWIDYNTIRTTPYLDRDFAPIIIYEV